MKLASHIAATCPVRVMSPAEHAGQEAALLLMKDKAGQVGHYRFLGLLHADESQVSIFTSSGSGLVTQCRPNGDDHVIAVVGEYHDVRRAVAHIHRLDEVDAVYQPGFLCIL